MRKAKSREIGPNISRPHRERYRLDQCALFRIGSKKRLALVLHCTVAQLILMSRAQDNYKIFEIKPKYDDILQTTRKSRNAQEPKAELRRIHQRVLNLLQWVEVPTYLHSAIKGRSYFSNADRHKDGCRLLKIDIRRFFPSTTESRIYNFFRDQLECAPDVARLVAKLVTCNGVLPTGSPLSPLLSFHANRPLFDTLAKFAADRELTFTCYVDDLTFSGDAVSAGMAVELTRLIETHGHKLSEEKTRFYRKGSARTVTGIVLKDGQKFVPNERMRKARILQRALKVEKDLDRRQHLAERLNGLVGEASTIDARFVPWAQSMRAQLKVLRNQCTTASNAAAKPPTPATSRSGQEVAPPWDKPEIT